METWPGVAAESLCVEGGGLLVRRREQSSSQEGNGGRDAAEEDEVSGEAALEAAPPYAVYPLAISSQHDLREAWRMNTLTKMIGTQCYAP